MSLPLTACLPALVSERERDKDSAEGRRIKSFRLDVDAAGVDAAAAAAAAA
eukprot:CAMPEP_0175103258 /NCGR_PEP_ID=MMETSP0086_2-20121207/8965_1 /TAXON_ID=136419 /ORGANISM="Unknown Unknown, Strain D1" /LENGTH=50 /DNA_ID=CAMNT_0016378305 /DNA_START=142 /DNA_END=290 /DNA_ORIENTATION=+